MPLAGKRASFDAIDNLPLPYIELDARGIILRANRAALSLHPPEVGDLVGQPAWKFLTCDQKEESFAAYAELIQTGQQPPAVLRQLYDRSGQYRTYEFNRSFILDDNGMPCGMRMICRDVTDTMRALDEAQQVGAYLSAIFDCIDAPLMVTDALGFIGFVNPACEELLGRAGSELLGKTIEEGLPVISLPGEDPFWTFCTTWKSRDGPVPPSTPVMAARSISKSAHRRLSRVRAASPVALSCCCAASKTDLRHSVEPVSPPSRPQPLSTRAHTTASPVR